MQLTQKITTAFIMLALLLSGVLWSASVASAHDDDHDHDEKEEMTPATKIAMMEEMVKLLQEVVALLQVKATMHAGALHGHDESNKHTLSTMTISVEEHNDVTHVHVNEAGKPANNFFLEDIALSERDAIIAAIAEKIDMTEAEVKAIATFKADVHTEVAGESHAGMDGLAGIHIMADGSVMLGNGAVVSDATITDDDMIKLGDGTLVEPTADMR